MKHPDWHDFGPTFASEQLAKRHKIQVGKETLRGWMIEAGLWKPGARRIEDVHCWVTAKCLRRMVQWTLPSTIGWKDAAGALPGAADRRRDQLELGRFVERDATPFNMAVLWEYLERTVGW